MFFHAGCPWISLMLWLWVGHKRNHQQKGHSTLVKGFCILENTFLKKIIFFLRYKLCKIAWAGHNSGDTPLSLLREDTSVGVTPPIHPTAFFFRPTKRKVIDMKAKHRLFHIYFIFHFHITLSANKKKCDTTEEKTVFFFCTSHYITLILIYKNTCPQLSVCVIIHVGSCHLIFNLLFLMRY